MIGPGPAVAQTAWTRAVVDGLLGAGVRDLVVSPGSRSTPLVCAALASGLRCHPVIDERSAAFFALGQARVTGRATATLCTSGSAGAHMYPAVLEAFYSHLPLVVITADRPPALQNCGAPQAMDQTKLFGHAVRGFADLGLPDATHGGVRAARRRVAQLVHAARTPTPGPVHLNVPAYKPLEPAAPTCDADRAFVANVERILAQPVTSACVPTQRVAEADIDALTAACRAADRGLIIAGPAPVDQHAARASIHALARATGFPLLVEAASQLRFVGENVAHGSCDAFEVLLRSETFAASTTPDLIIQLGPTPVSAAWRDFLARLARTTSCARWVLCAHGWQDATSDARALLTGDVADAAARVARSLGDAEPQTRWNRRMQRATRRAWHHIEHEFTAAGALTEPAAIRAIVTALPEQATLALGNSLPIRDADVWCRSRDAKVPVLTQRGLNGIDGLIAGAAGAASVGDRPVVLVLGDVSASHDIGSLAAARDLRNPLVITVIDNGGGRIFDRLPIADSVVEAAAFERFWRTPPACDVAAAATAYGLQVASPTDAAGIATAVREGCQRPGASLVHVRVVADSADTCFARVVSAFDAAWREDDDD